MFILSLSFEFYRQRNGVREKINASPKVTWISDGRDKEGFLMLESMYLIITLPVFWEDTLSYNILG